MCVCACVCVSVSFSRALRQSALCVLYHSRFFLSPSLPHCTADLSLSLSSARVALLRMRPKTSSPTHTHAHTHTHTRSEALFLFSGSPFFFFSSPFLSHSFFPLHPRHCGRCTHTHKHTHTNTRIALSRFPILSPSLFPLSLPPTHTLLFSTVFPAFFFSADCCAHVRTSNSSWRAASTPSRLSCVTREATCTSTDLMARETAAERRRTPGIMQTNANGRGET